MRWIFISPHLDDAILSMGGLIYEQTRRGETVQIWTLACGFPNDEELSPFTRRLHGQWGFRSAEETVRSRREEDFRAANIVGAQAVHFDFPDCIYRRGRDGKWLYHSTTFVPPAPDDANFSRHMTSVLAERLEPDDEVVCPLAIGGHVDHVIVRQAVENLQRPLWYYADFPYLHNNPSALNAIERAMQGERQKISWRGMFAWKKGAGAYVSQIPMEFENPRKMRKAIAGYARGGVRLWKPSGT